MPYSLCEVAFTETTTMQLQTNPAGFVSASSTRGEQAEFTGFENTKFPLRAAVVSKRPRGRPRGPRGFCFSVPGTGARDAVSSAVRLISKCRCLAMMALVFRRIDARHALGHANALFGRRLVHCALAALLAAVLRLKGGAL